MIHKWQKCEDKEQHVSCFIVASASHFDGHGFFFKNPLSVKERGTPNLIKHMFWRFRKKVKLPYFSLGNIVFIFLTGYIRYIPLHPDFLDASTSIYWLQRFAKYPLPIGSMVLVYMLTLGVYWWDPCYHI